MKPRKRAVKKAKEILSTALDLTVYALVEIASWLLEALLGGW